jgi:hypothetical protein
MKKTWIRRNGAFKLNGKIIPAGTPFEALESEIPKGARDIIVPYEVQEEVRKPYMERLTGPWWNVFDADGRKVNQRGLKEEDAKKLLETM